MKDIRDYSIEEFSTFSADFMSKNIGMKQNIKENIILKAHVISEFTLNCYIESISKSGKLNMFKQNITYSKKIFLAEEFGNLPVEIIEILKKLNKIRNEYAHRLILDNEKLESLYHQIIKLHNKNNQSIILNKNDIIEYFKNTSYLLSYINGYIFGLYKKEKNKSQNRI
ncbi:hypothetical protein [Xanthomarina sp.]|uniref:hypothetical protein n=1 Tax=Xanthomarina sp. TaxID=1931211 RepID=UPI002C942EE5|nr:hypothetical protein [Xanthomarina sp.]HLV40227.1 hypothetical protein [Xanthomarina sp.]